MGEAGLRRLFWIVLAEIVLYVLLDAVAQLLPPHYSPISNAESDLAVGPYGYIMAINFVNRGILSIVFLYAFVRTAKGAGQSVRSNGSSGLKTGAYLLGLWAVGSILLAAFPTDVPPTPISWHGAIHGVLALIVFVGGVLGALMLSRRFGEIETLKRMKGKASALAYFSTVSLVVTLVSLTTPVGGLTERIFLGSVLLWIAIVSGYLAKSKGPVQGTG